jgi:hypothetical protein
MNLYWDTLSRRFKFSPQHCHKPRTEVDDDDNSGMRCASFGMREKLNKQDGQRARLSVPDTTRYSPLEK